MSIIGEIAYDTHLAETSVIRLYREEFDVDEGDLGDALICARLIEVLAFAWPVYMLYRAVKKGGERFKKKTK